MLESQKLELRASEIRERLNEISGLEGDALTADIRAEAGNLHAEYGEVETRRRAAIVAEDEAEERAKAEAGIELDSETRERLELRRKVRALDFLQAAIRGRQVDGAASEYSEAEGAGGDIPLALFEPDPREVREAEERAVTGAPGTVGVNMAPIVPFVFARSIAGAMGIDMPMVKSGTFGQARISTALTAGARTKGAAQAATAAAFAVGTATPKSVSAALEFLAEDVASAGHGNFEAALRDNLQMALSAELDNQFINGNGTAPNLRGILAALADPTAASDVLTFDSGIITAAGLVDGLWAEELGQVRQIVGVDTFRKMAVTFQPGKLVSNGTAPANSVGAATDGPMSLADWLKANTDGLRTNLRMPAPATNVQAGIAFRTGRAGMRTAVSPHWGRISITDVYSGATKAQTTVALHILVGDVIVVQPGAYAQTSYKVA